MHRDGCDISGRVIIGHVLHTTCIELAHARSDHMARDHMGHARSDILGHVIIGHVIHTACIELAHARRDHLAHHPFERVMHADAHPGASREPSAHQLPNRHACAIR